MNTTTDYTVPTVHVIASSSAGARFGVALARSGRETVLLRVTGDEPHANTIAAEVRGALADAYLAGQAAGMAAARLTEAPSPALAAPFRPLEPATLTTAQELALTLLCKVRGVEFSARHFYRDNPPGRVGGWICGPAGPEFVVLDADGIMQ